VFVVVHQGAGNTVTDSASLRRTAATSDSNKDVELAQSFSQFKRLTNHHATSHTTEIQVEVFVVDGNFARARLHKHASGGGLAAPGTVILLCHGEDFLRCSVQAAVEQHADARHRRTLLT